MSPPGSRGQPFVRVLSGSGWTVQVGSTTDPAAAAAHRDRLARRGLDAFLEQATIGNTSWQRILVGHYATRAEAERGIAELGEGTRERADPPPEE